MREVFQLIGALHHISSALRVEKLQILICEYKVEVVAKNQTRTEAGAINGGLDLPGKTNCVH